MSDAVGTGGNPSPVSALDHRLMQAGLIAPQTSTLAVRTGVLVAPGSTALVTGTSATGTMTVSIAAHHWVTTRGTADGVYIGAKEAAGTVNIAPAPGANSRIDVIYVRQKDASSSISPDGASAEEYGVVTGTAAASPTKPAFTAAHAGAIELATVQVAAGATATNGAGVTITQTAVQTVARGAPVPVRNQTERDALTAFDGLSVKRLDAGGVEEQSINGTWVRQERRPPVSAARISGINLLPVAANATTAPPGTGLTLPALPVNTVIVVELSTTFYIEGFDSFQNLTGEIVTPTGVTLLTGAPGRQLGVSQLPVSLHTRKTYRIDTASAVSFGSSYTTGVGSQRAILQREDWTAWL